MKLCELKDRPGARKRKMLVGRGIGSGKGKTSGRGGKGQTARSGVRLKGFQGGQTPLSRRLPKRGFTNIHALEYVEVNVGSIQKAIDENKIDIKQVINADTLQACGLFKQKRDGVRLLGNGDIAVTIEVSGVSAKARELIESKGGKVVCVKTPGFSAKARELVESEGSHDLRVKG